MLVLGWNGEPPSREELRRALVGGDVLDHLSWCVDGDLFSPVGAEEGPELSDGNAPVEALAHAAWKAHST